MMKVRFSVYTHSAFANFKNSFVEQLSSLSHNYYIITYLAEIVTGENCVFQSLQYVPFLLIKKKSQKYLLYFYFSIFTNMY